jgi:hypothetical protein
MIEACLKLCIYENGGSRDHWRQIQIATRRHCRCLKVREGVILFSASHTNVFSPSHLSAKTIAHVNARVHKHGYRMWFHVHNCPTSRVIWHYQIRYVHHINITWTLSSDDENDQLNWLPVSTNIGVEVNCRSVTVKRIEIWCCDKLKFKKMFNSK